MNASASFPNGIPAKLDDNMIDRDILVFKQYLNWSSPVVRKSDIDRLYLSWKWIVRLYSARSLTQEKDRLIALDLSWTLKDANMLPTYRLEWRAPSWSWALVDTAIDYLRPDEFTEVSYPISLAEFIGAEPSSGRSLGSSMFSIRKIRLRRCLIKTFARKEERSSGWTITIADLKLPTYSVNGTFYPDLNDAQDLGKKAIWYLPLAHVDYWQSGHCLLQASYPAANQYVRLGVYKFSMRKLSNPVKGESLKLDVLGSESAEFYTFLSLRRCFE